MGVEIQCGWDLHPRVEIMHALAYKIIVVLVALFAELRLVHYIMEIFLPFILTLGLALRILPFTRGIGGLLIALVLGFYFIYPTAFMIYDLGAGAQAFSTAPIVQPLSQCYASFGGNAQLAQQGYGAMQQAIQVQNDAQQKLIALMLNAIYVPLVILAVTLLFIRAFSPMFGSESGDVMMGIAKML